MDASSTERSFLELYESSADAVFRHLYFKVGDRELARDLTEESFCRVWEYLSKGKKIDNLKAFVFRTANNLTIDHYRKKKELSLDTLAEDGFEPSDGEDERMTFAVEARAAFAAVEQLDAKQKEVIMMRYVSGLSVGEIADALGEAENTVSVRIHRAVKRLREILHYETTD